MSDLAGAIWLAMEGRYGGRAPKSAPDTTRGRLARMRALEAGYGGPKGAARQVGVSAETWRRWKQTGKKSQHPSAPRLASLVRASDTVYRAMSVRTAERELRRAKVRVCADIMWNGYLDTKTPYRCTSLDRLNLSAWAIQWAGANLAALAQELWHQMKEHYGVSVLLQGDLVTVQFLD